MSNYIPPEFVIINDKPTELEFTITQATNCSVEIEDITPVYNGTTLFGFLPEMMLVLIYTTSIRKVKVIFITFYIGINTILRQICVFLKWLQQVQCLRMEQKP